MSDEPAVSENEIMVAEVRIVQSMDSEARFIFMICRSRVMARRLSRLRLWS